MSLEKKEANPALVEVPTQNALPENSTKLDRFERWLDGFDRGARSFQWLLAAFIVGMLFGAGIFVVSYLATGGR